MQKPHTRQISWLLLVLLALRGLVPVGYMIDASDHRLSIVICDSGIYSSLAQSSHAHHHHGTDKATGHDHSICPFAMAATGASAPYLPVLAAADSGPVIAARFESNLSIGLCGPSRAQQSRAPPDFS